MDAGTTAAKGDVIEGRGGNDALNGGAGADTLFAGPANDFLNGGPYSDAGHAFLFQHAKDFTTQVTTFLTA